MAFRASTATQAQGLLAAMQQAAWLRQQAQQGVTMLQGNVTANQLFQLLDNTRAPLAIFTSVVAIPGIAAYAQAQFNDPTYNVATEFNAMVAAVNSVVDWVVTNFPKDAQQFIQAYKIETDGSRTATVFTTAQTGGLVTALNALIASIS